ncbi:hypothetical protein ADL02_12215 [Streptomyces sp. NRRL WC-3723]|nr:hypothetical protein ADL02_12215 [Streptomyces sp. NRRL WC-3723]
MDDMSNTAGGPPGRGPRHATGRDTAHGVLRALTVLLLVCLTAFGAACAANAADSADGDGLVKVFVVPDPAQTGGTLDTLRTIAADTLGDASRSGEIFTLNRGQTQRDGSALTSPDEPLHPGWILRLPPDASGPDVQLARDGSVASGSSPGTGTGTAPPADGGGGTTTTVFTIPLAAAIAVVVAVLLALVTGALVARGRTRATVDAVARAVRRLGAPVRRRRRLTLRRALGRRLASDTASLRRAYAVLGEVTAAPEGRERPVYAVRVDDAGATVWLEASDTVAPPWRHTDGTRWSRSVGGAAAPALDSATEACLVRVGYDAEGELVFVDLSRLDGVLSVTGDQSVARDVLGNLLAEIALSRPGIPVTVLSGPDSVPLPVPGTLVQVPRPTVPTAGPGEPEGGTVRATASRRPVRGLVVMTGTPSEHEAADLAALCGPGGAGWTGLVYGDVGGAHWRWHTDADGDVDLPVLGVRLIVPA